YLRTRPEHRRTMTLNWSACASLALPPNFGGMDKAIKQALMPDGYKSRLRQTSGTTLMKQVMEPARPQTALVLDDEAQIGIIVCKVLSLIGIEAQHFTDPLAFLIEMKRSQPSLIVLDLALGQSDAVEVIRKLDVLKFPGR